MPANASWGRANSTSPQAGQYLSPISKSCLMTLTRVVDPTSSITWPETDSSRIGGVTWPAHLPFRLKVKFTSESRIAFLAPGRTDEAPADTSLSPFARNASLNIGDPNSEFGSREICVSPRQTNDISTARLPSASRSVQHRDRSEPSGTLSVNEMAQTK